ncbi:MAG TPA: carbohydrate binding domain-containing protein [Armatimonadota bacterium]|nr:carbohydrate binding domain-containing protein [Armatimonadota bacterium]
MLVALLLACHVAAQPVSLMYDGDFEHRPVDLSMAAGCTLDSEVAHSGEQSFRIEVKPEPGAITNGSATWAIEDFVIGESYTVSAWAKTAGVTGNEGRKGYAYLSVYQYDQFGDYVAYFDFKQITGDTDWTRYTYTFTVGDGAERVNVNMGLFQAHGTLWVDDCTLVQGSQALDITEVTRPAPIDAGTRPAVAILHDDFPKLGAPSDPVYLKEILDATDRYQVDLISSAGLADRNILSPRRYDLVILPHGPCFPAEAADAFRRFLRGGGDFLAMGGYAFDHLIFDEEPEAAEPPPQETSLHYRIPAQDLRGQTVKFTGNLRCKGVSGAGFAYLAVYQYGPENELLTWRDTVQLRGDRDWTSNTYTVTVDERAEHIDIKIGLYLCTGTASFDDIQLADEAGNALVTDPSFEETGDLDTSADHQWYRTQPDLASIVTTTPLSGERCARVKLAAAASQELIMNTARGQAADGLKVTPDQIGVFDASFPLKRVEYAKAAPEQFIISPDFLADAPMSGWSATSVLGYNDARRVPLVTAHDRYGRLRGSVGSITYRYAGRYARSAWAIFGAENFDLFPRGAPASAELLVPVVDALVTETFLHNLETDLACYRQGEPVEIRVKASNYSDTDRDGIIDVTIYPGDADQGISLKPLPITLRAGETDEFPFGWSPGASRDNFYRVEATLEVDGRVHDLMKTGFVVWDEEAIASGPDCIMEDNLFKLNGREHFLQGTDSFSFQFYSAHENPLIWKRDMSTMRDSGMNLAENLQIGAASQSPPYEWPQDFLRKTDAMIQLAQQHGQVYMPGLLIGYNVVAEGDVLEKEASWVRAFVERYKDVPGIIWYINGDFRLDLAEAINLAHERGGEVPRTDVERLWNEFLNEKYASRAEIEDAWGAARVPADLGKIPLDDYGWGSEWADMRGVDLTYFKFTLMNRWINRHVRAIREVDPHHAITSEWYRSPMPGIDLPLTIGDHDCANIGYFDGPETDIVGFVPSMRFADMRARGKSLSAGEFGVKTHPAWADTKHPSYHAMRTDEEQEQLWLAITHQAWGLGASKIHNWSWKDNVESIFPWGMVYPGDWVKKDCLDVYRASGLTFRQFERTYEPPEVYVLTPDAHRVGYPVRRVYDGIRNCFLGLQNAGVQVGTLNECALGEIPESAKMIFYPIPYQIPDDVYATLLKWVEAGGRLYVSGDVSYDANRRRTKTDRLEELCGVEFVKERYPNIMLADEAEIDPDADDSASAANPAIEVRVSGAEVLTEKGGLPILTANEVGDGKVIFSTWPCELHGQFGGESSLLCWTIYLSALNEVGWVHEAVGGASFPFFSAAPISTAIARGGQADVFLNVTDEPHPRVERQRDITPTMAPHRTALTVRGAKDKLLAFEDGAGAHFACYSLDREDVSKSKRLVVLPMTEGRATLETAVRWENPVAVVGEVTNGEWVEYERLDLNARGGKLRLRIDENRMFSIIIICEEPDVGRCARQVERSLLEPWKLP